MIESTPTSGVSPAARLATEAQRERLAQLRQRRAPAPGGTTPLAGSSHRPRRRHPAQGSRIAAAGLGIATMLGLVGAMGFAQSAASSASSAAAVVGAVPAPSPANVVVVLHPSGAAAVPATVPTVATDPTTPAPIALSPQPVVRRAPAAAAPVAKTHASR